MELFPVYALKDATEVRHTRKYLIIIAACTILFVVSACSMSGIPGAILPSSNAVLAGKIVHLYKDSCLIAVSESSDLRIVSSKTRIYDGDNHADASALKAGQNVKIGYSGSVTKSYPARLKSPAYIKISDQGDDLVGLYQTVLNDMIDDNSGGASGVDIFAFNLSHVGNLTDAEKGALIYLMSEEYGLKGITGTKESLVEQGYISKDKIRFESILFTIEINSISEDDFNFNAEMWRGGDWIYEFINCQAVKTDNGWSYKVGSVGIS